MNIQPIPEKYMQTYITLVTKCDRSHSEARGDVFEMMIDDGVEIHPSW